MKQIHAHLGIGLITASLIAVPVAAQQGGTSQPGSGTRSGQTTGSTTGSSGSSRSQDRERDKTTSYGEKVGEDVPSAGTQTDQRGRTAARGGADTPGALKGADRTFLLDAMEGNRAEVALARLAQQKADSQAVRDLARTIETHHQQANDTLQKIASSIGAPDNATELKPKHKQLQDRLSRLDAAAFDKAYASEMVKEHQKDIQTYEKASRQLQHPELKAYATETLPHLKQHLDKARTAGQEGGQSRTQ